MARTIQTMARKRAKYGDAIRLVSNNHHNHTTTAAAAAPLTRPTNTLDILAMAATTHSMNSSPTVVTPTHFSSACGGMEHPFVLLELQVVRHILGFVVAPFAPQRQREVSPFSNSTARQQQYHHDQNDEQQHAGTCLLGTCWVLASVCQQWNLAVGCLLNAKAPALIISSQNLYFLKCRALCLNLSNIGHDFMEFIREMWGHAVIRAFGQEEVSCMNVVIRHFGGTQQGFIELVASEYVKFLIVKSVERMAHNNAWIKEPRLVARWKEPCTPPMLVQLFWKAHFMNPRQYAVDCNLLVGNLLYSPKHSMDNILDCNVTTASSSNNLFTTTSTIRGSDYESKKSVLFRVERQFPFLETYLGRFGTIGVAGEYLFSEWFNPTLVASRLAEEM